ncbi:MAG: ribonuclease D [Chlamydiales bacterium]|jgi:ribonuclease D
MSQNELPPPILVEDADGLAALVEDLEGQSEIAIDTEADSFYSFREKVCLVQVTVEDRDYVVDPLAGFDLAPMREVLADPNKIKVFHDGEYDVLILKRDHDLDFAGLFDTRVAAATLGTDSPGLASVLGERFDVEIDKSMQRSDWAKRPLTEKQIRYARLDTHYLLPLMRELRPELEECGRAMIVETECRRLEALTPNLPQFRPDDFVKIKGVRRLPQSDWQVIRELYALREDLASRSDVPPFRIMRNPIMLDLAHAQPDTLDQLARTPGFSPRMVRSFGDKVLDAVAKARSLGELDRLPVLPKRDGTEGMSESEVELYDRLKKWRKGIAGEQQVEASYLLNRHVMARIARSRPTDADALAGIDGFCPWQTEMFGAQLLTLIGAFESAVEAGDIPKRKPWRRR